MKQTELYALLWNKNANTRKMASVRSAHYPSTVEEMVDNGHEKTEVSRKSRTSILTIRPAASQGPAKNPTNTHKNLNKTHPSHHFSRLILLYEPIQKDVADQPKMLILTGLKPSISPL